MQEVLSWLGLPATIGIAFFAIRALFNELEKVTSPKRKKDLSDFLQSADWNVLPLRITATVREAFEAIFGTNQFSWKCLRRSVAFSLSAILALFVLGFLNHFDYFKTMPSFVLYHPGYKYIFFGWLIWNLLFDFFNLYKTRLIIRLIDKRRLSLLIFLVIFALDLSISFIVFVVSQNFLNALNMVAQLCLLGHCSLNYETATSISMFHILNYNPDVWIEKFSYVKRGLFENEIAIFFWSGLLPALWLLVYILATTLTRWLVNNADLISFTVSWLNIEKSPFEAVGFVAACMVATTMIVHALISSAIG